MENNPYYAQINFHIDIFPVMHDGSLDTSKKLSIAEMEGLKISHKAVFGVQGFNRDDCISKLKQVLERLSYE